VIEEWYTANGITLYTLVAWDWDDIPKSTRVTVKWDDLKFMGCNGREEDHKARYLRTGSGIIRSRVKYCPGCGRKLL